MTSFADQTPQTPGVSHCSAWEPLDGAKNREMTVAEDIVGVHRSALLR